MVNRLISIEEASLRAALQQCVSMTPAVARSAVRRPPGQPGYPCQKDCWPVLRHAVAGIASILKEGGVTPAAALVEIKSVMRACVDVDEASDLETAVVAWCIEGYFGERRRHDN